MASSSPDTMVALETGSYTMGSLVENEKLSSIEKNDTPLFMAAFCGHVDLVRTLLQLGADVNVGNYQNRNGQAPLIAAVHKQHFEVVKVLLENGANIEATYNKTGATVLYVACHLGNTTIAEYLLKKGANPNARDFVRGETCLHVVCRMGYVSIISLLLQHGANIHIKSNEDNFPWERAFSTRNDPVLQVLLKHGFNVNQGALILACKKRDLWGINWLLNNGADVEGGGDVVSPLATAAKSGYWEVITILLEHGANVNVVDETGVSPLWHMCMAGYVEIAKSLIHHGADLNARKNEYSMTPLQLVASKCQTQVMESLSFELAARMVRGGANVDAIYLKKVSGATERTTTLHIAINAKFTRVIKLLAENNAKFLPKLTTIDDGRITIERKTVWEMAGENKDFIKALSLPWSPDTHTRQHPTLRARLDCFLLVCKRLERKYPNNILFLILKYVTCDWQLITPNRSE